jgi:hypothetical protein
MSQGKWNPREGNGTRVVPPHPATVAQKKTAHLAKAAPHREPHPATVVAQRPPHAAAVAQRRVGRAPHPATVAPRREPHPATVVQQRAPHPPAAAPDLWVPPPAPRMETVFALRWSGGASQPAPEPRAGRPGVRQGPADAAQAATGGPGAIQRNIIRNNVANGDKYTAALAAIEQCLGRTPNTSQVFTLAARDEIDLVFISAIPWHAVAVYGYTTPYVGYGTGNRRRLEDAINVSQRTGVPLGKITIEINAVMPRLQFWNRTKGNIASTLAHELTIHAGRFVPAINRILANGGQILPGDIRRWQAAGIFSAEAHHAVLAIGEMRDQRIEYRALVQDLIRFWRTDGTRDETAATDLNSAYFSDLWEHTPGVMPSIFGLFGVTLSDDF